MTRRTLRDAPAATAAAPVAAGGAVAGRGCRRTGRRAAARGCAGAGREAEARRIRRFLRKALVAIAFAMVLNEIRVYMIAGALAPNVPQDSSGLIQMWGQHAALDQRQPEPRRQARSNAR